MLDMAEAGAVDKIYDVSQSFLSALWHFMVIFTSSNDLGNFY